MTGKLEHGVCDLSGSFSDRREYVPPARDQRSASNRIQGPRNGGPKVLWAFYEDRGTVFPEGLAVEAQLTPLIADDLRRKLEERTPEQ